MGSPGSAMALRPSSTLVPAALEASPGLYRPPRSSAFHAGFPFRTCMKPSFCGAWALTLAKSSNRGQTLEPEISSTASLSASWRQDIFRKRSGSSRPWKASASLPACAEAPWWAFQFPSCGPTVAASRTWTARAQHSRMDCSSSSRWSSRSASVVLSALAISPRALNPAITSRFSCMTSETRPLGTGAPGRRARPPPPCRRLDASAFFALLTSRFACRSIFATRNSLENERSSLRQPPRPDDPGPIVCFASSAINILCLAMSQRTSNAAFTLSEAVFAFSSSAWRVSARVLPAGIAIADNQP
mmetsp:Transcript_149908/g.462772  ORF Transcript_149908/g.462772 Transcript_149908/m.462772 type:complete len:302 (-) Transcript_149908:844-1749(-)